MRILVMIAISLLCGVCAATPISGVTVRDSTFQVVKVLGQAELVRFEAHWLKKQKVDISLRDAGGQHFKLNVNQGASDMRWLYQTTGFVTLLSKQKKPVYRILDIEAFNKLIGAEH